MAEWQLNNEKGIMKFENHYLGTIIAIIDSKKNSG